MRTTILICDHCNADMTDAARTYGEWQGIYSVSGGRGDDRISLEVCSRECLLAALALRPSRPPR